MRTIVWQTSISIGEQALEVEQRSDVRVRLPVVITEEAFVITDQAREHVGSDKLEVIRKSLIRRELDCPVKTLRATKALRRAGNRWIAGAGCFFSGARSDTAGVEDEVGIAIVERTVFDDVNHRAINTASSENYIAADFILEAGSDTHECSVVSDPRSAGVA